VAGIRHSASLPGIDAARHPVSIKIWLRQMRTLSDPAGAVAARVLLERAGPQRWDRLRQATTGRLRERVIPSRPKMQTLVLRPGGRFEWQTLPCPPPPGPRAAIVRPLAVATCDMDRPLALGATPFLRPLSVGHECVAEVIEVGTDVDAVRPGQRVVVPFQINCGSCAACRAGLTASCSSVPPVSLYGFGVMGGHWGGAISEQLTVPFANAMLVPLPDGVTSAAAASVADNVSDAYRHIGPHLPGVIARGAQARVLIVGAQSRRHLFTASVSLYAGLIARCLGASDVVLADSRPEVRDQARSLGLVARSPKDVRRLAPFPLVCDVSASPAGLRFALKMTAPDGICSSSGSLRESARIPSLLMYGRNITLSIGKTNARAVIPDVLSLMSSGKLQPELVTTLIADLDDAREALTEHVQRAYAKTIVVREGAS
jgi:alcohol dehydrogenase